MKGLIFQTVLKMSRSTRPVARVNTSALRHTARRREVSLISIISVDRMMFSGQNQVKRIGNEKFLTLVSTT